MKSLTLRRSLPSYIQVSQNTYLITLAAVIGLGSGFLSVIFRWLVELFQEIFFGHGARLLGFLGEYYVILLPALGGLMVGPLVYYFAREAKGHGVPEVMAAVALKGGRIRPRVVAVKALASALTIGSGGSAGAEGPIVQMGAGIGSTIAQRLKLSEHTVKTLVGCGAAAGISATFNAPIAGVMFSLEVIMGEFTAHAFSLMVLSSVSASVVAQRFLGNAPAFAVPPYELISYIELFFYLVLGILSSAIAIAYVRTLYAFEDRFDAVKRVPEWVKPAIGGLAAGLIGLFYPQAFGTGYKSIEAALHGELAIGLLIILMFVKVLATSFTIGSGGSGGVFAPSLFVGAMAGGAFGGLVHSLNPAATASPGAYALVGMGAVFAASAQAPITSIIMIFELTRDYRIILPLMIACVISSLVASMISRENIYTLKLLRRGIDLKAGKDVGIMRSILVRDAMTRKVNTVTDSMTLGDVIRIMQDDRHTGFPVVDGNGGRLVGMITLQDIRNTPLERRLNTRVGDVMARDLAIAYPDETLNDIARRFGTKDIGRLPVVDRDDPQKLVGLITRSDVIKAYNRALVERNGGEPAGRSS